MSVPPPESAPPPTSEPPATPPPPDTAPTPQPATATQPPGEPPANPSPTTPPANLNSPSLAKGWHSPKANDGVGAAPPQPASNDAQGASLRGSSSESASIARANSPAAPVAAGYPSPPNEPPATSSPTAPPADSSSAPPGATPPPGAPPPGVATPKPTPLYRRFLLPLLIYAVFVSILTQVHDYPQLANQVQLIQRGDFAANRSRWLLGFYFINESASGIKFFLTDNEKHFTYYPSSSHILASRIRRSQAGGGDWQLQFVVARMYYFGEHTPQNRELGIAWLKKAIQNAPKAQKPILQSYLAQARRETYQNFQ